MSFKALLLGSLTSLAVIAPGAAQIGAESMSDIDAWGARYLTSDESEFPSTLWSGSSDQTLLELMQTVETFRLTPAERALLRRVILSPTRRPRGSLADALLAERARLMLELGEASAAAALAPRLKQDARGLDAETIAVDLEMARGQEASACDRLSGPVPDGLYWLKLRAVCAVLRENYSGAELAVEVASAQGLDDQWFVEAIFAASGDVPNPPGAKFDSGLNIALSSKADLDLSQITFSGSRPDLAAATANRPGVPDDLRARFAEIAAESDLISDEARREILAAPLADPDYQPRSELETTLQALLDPLLSDYDKAERLNVELVRAADSNFATFASTASLFKQDLAKLPKSYELGEFGLIFARAALATGDTGLVNAWLEAAISEPPIQPGIIAPNEALNPGIEIVEPATPGGPIKLTRSPPLGAAEPGSAEPEEEPGAEAIEGETSKESDLLEEAVIEEAAEPEAPPRPVADPFEVAALQSLNLMLGGAPLAGSAREAQTDLIEASQSFAERQYAAHLLTLWTGFGVTLGQDGRALVMAEADTAARIEPYRLIAIDSAARSGAIGEAALLAIGVTDGAPEALASADMAGLISALRRVEAEDVAASFAVEASGMWRLIDRSDSQSLMVSEVEP